MIGGLVEIVAGLQTVTMTCAGVVVAEHRRSWARRGTVTCPQHVEQAKQLRLDYWKRHHQQPPMNSFADSVVRLLSDLIDRLVHHAEVLTLGG